MANNFKLKLLNKETENTAGITKSYISKWCDSDYQENNKSYEENSLSVNK